VGPRIEGRIEVQAVDPEPALKGAMNAYDDRQYNARATIPDFGMMTG